MKVSPSSPLWKCLRPVRASPDWIETFATGSEMSVQERDALVDLIWGASCERSREFFKFTSAEVRSACEKLATLLKSEHHDLALHTLMLAVRCPWSEPKRLILEALADISEARAFICDFAKTDSSWVLRRDAVGVIGKWGDDPSVSPTWAEIFAAADDPHWRVRLAVVESAENRAAILTWPTVFERAHVAWRRYSTLSQVRKKRVNGVWRQLHVAANQELGAITPCPFESLEESPSTVGRAESTSEEIANWIRNPDPQVVAWQLRQRFEHLDPTIDLAACKLLGDLDEDVAKEARRRLHHCSDISMLANALQWLDDPRHPGFTAFQMLVADLDEDRIKALAHYAFNDKSPQVQAWGLCQLAEIGGVEETSSAREFVGDALQHPDACVRQAAATAQASSLGPDQVEAAWRLVAFCESDAVAAWIGGLPPLALASVPRQAVERCMKSEESRLRARVMACAATYPDLWPVASQDNSPEVRVAFAKALHQQSSEKHRWLAQLQCDPHPQVRCSAVDSMHAERLMKSPEQETSWAVLRQAAYLQKQTIPHRTLTSETLRSESPILPVKFGQSQKQRVVIPGLPQVAPLGLSGHYHLPERGFHLAAEAGVELMFFEPNYATMTRFMRSLSHGDRHRIQLVAGSFSANPKEIRSDIDRTLRLLRRDTIDLFLLFWVRDWTRVSEEAINALEVARSSGAIRAFSLSTHNLTVAADALTRGWAPVMVRHNAAHTRAEETVLPLASRLSLPVILFNNTCYGRLLGKRTFDEFDLTAEDCYRYSLSQPGARACWMAPATIEQLQANLTVLDGRPLDPDRREYLLSRGTVIRRLDHAVGNNLRLSEGV